MLFPLAAFMLTLKLLLSLVTRYYFVSGALTQLVKFLECSLLKTEKAK